MKTCPKCRIEKDEDEFFKNKKPRWKGDELSSWCKTCNKRRHRDAYPRIRKKKLKEASERWKNMSLEEKQYRSEQKKIKNKKDRLLVLEKYGNKCTCCGETELKFLEIDHINNDGAEHRRMLGSSRIISWLIKENFPDGFQLLCSNCNMAKGRYGECPHQINKLKK